MKANEAPKKLYIALNELTEDGRTFVLDHRVDYPTCTEYVRTDAVIEWIKEMWSETNDRFKEDYTGMLIEIFKNYIKRE